MGALVATRHVPALKQRRQQRIEQRLSERLRIDADLTQQQTPKPGLTRYSTAALAGFAAQHANVDLEKIEIRQAAEFMAVKIDSATMSSDTLGELLQVAQRELQSPSAKPVMVSIKRLAIENSVEFIDARLKIDQKPGSDLKRLRFKAHEPGSPDQAAALNVLVEQQAAGGWKAKLDTGHMQLPLPLAALVLPVLDTLQEGRFQGIATWEGQETKITGTLQGRIEGCQFGALLPARFAAHATGQASFEIEELKFSAERMEKLAGVLSVQQGNVGAPLFKALESKLFCRPVAENLATPGITPQKTIAFEAIAARVVFNNMGLSLWGNFPEDANQPEAKLMVRNARPLLLQPPWVELPAAYWIQFAAGDAPSAMPASRKAFELAGRLPPPVDVEDGK